MVVFKHIILAWQWENVIFTVAIKIHRKLYKTAANSWQTQIYLDYALMQSGFSDSDCSNCTKLDLQQLY